MENLQFENQRLLEKLQAAEAALAAETSLLTDHLGSLNLQKTVHLENLASYKQDRENRTTKLNDQIKFLRGSTKRDPLLLALNTIKHENPHIAETIAEAVGYIGVLDDMVKGLKFEMEKERATSEMLRLENQKLKVATINIQISAEQEEEAISNKLLKRISQLNQEKTDLLRNVEQEEEMITNTLQRKLEQLKKEKVDMEIALEQEQEFIVNRLQKQLESLQQGSSKTSTIHLQKRLSGHSPSSSFSDLLPMSIAPPMIEILRSEVSSLQRKLDESSIEHEETCLLFRKVLDKIVTELIENRKKLGLDITKITEEFNLNQIKTLTTAYEDQPTSSSTTQTTFPNPAKRISFNSSNPTLCTTTTNGVRPATSPIQLSPFDDIRHSGRNAGTRSSFSSVSGGVGAGSSSRLN